MGKPEAETIFLGQQADSGTGVFDLQDIGSVTFPASLPLVTYIELPSPDSRLEMSSYNRHCRHMPFTPMQVKLPAHTCPNIDKLKRMIRKHVEPGAERVKMLGLCESLREANSQLREACVQLMNSPE